MRKISNKGFTIIEVVLVLAIAAVIFLIVFLAVPALQRNNRNTNRKSEVGRLLSAYQEHITNNPAETVAGVTLAEIQGVVGTLQVYSTGLTVSNATVTAITNADTARVVPGGTCNGAAATASSNIRKVVVLYAVETAGDASPQCQQG